MQTLKNFLTGLCCTLIVLIIGVLTLFNYSKKTIEGPVLTETVKKMIQSNVPKDNEEINKVMEEVSDLEGVDEIINSFVDDYTKGEVSDQTIDTIMDFIKKNESTIKKMSTEEFDINEITSNESREELKNNLNKTYKELNAGDTSSPVNTTITVYSNITKYATVRNAIIACAILLTIIILLSWSYYKWIKSVSKILTSLGTMMLITYLLSLLLMNVINNLLHTSINSNELLFIGISELASGIILNIIYKKIDKVASTTQVNPNNELTIENPIKDEYFEDNINNNQIYEII